MTGIDTRLGRLEDLAAIERVRYQVSRVVDESANDGSALNSLQVHLAEDYTWEFNGPADTVAAPTAPSPTGSAAEFVAFLAGLAGRLTFSLQFLAGGIIDLDANGDSATGTWVVWHPFTIDGRAWVLAGRSHDRFVRGESGWLLAGARLEASLLSPWDVDWAKGV